MIVSKEVHIALRGEALLHLIVNGRYPRLLPGDLGSDQLSCHWRPGRSLGSSPCDDVDVVMLGKLPHNRKVLGQARPVACPLVEVELVSVEVEARLHYPLEAIHFSRWVNGLLPRVDLEVIEGSELEHP